MTADRDTAAVPVPAPVDARDGDEAEASEASEASEPWFDRVVRGSRLDDRWARLLSTPRRRALWYWGGPIAVTLLAAVLRFWDLGNPQSLIFDETYYVKDAWTLWHLGYEARWPDDFDGSFASGDVMGFLQDPAYVVHPPLGKWLIGLGMAAFGAGDAFWWRATTALAGTIAVFLVSVVARRLIGTTVIAVVAGLLLAVDGNAIVMSRVALLDNWVMLFLLVGFWFVLLDRDPSRRRLDDRLDRLHAAGLEPHYGPVIWNRPWVVAAGVAFGAACAVKWSGVWFLAAFGLYLVAVDALARRRAGLPFWLTGALLKQAPATFVLLVPVALVVYGASWAGWLLTDGGYYRTWALDPAHQATGLFAWAPHWLQSLWFYHQSAYTFHVGLHATHPWASNPLTWLVMGRPTNMYYRELDCGGSTCVASVMGIGNPLIWWGGTIALGYLVYRFARYRQWQVGLILLGLAASYLPWLAYIGRTVFQFYSIAFEPYLVLGLAFVLAVILGTRDDPSERRRQGIAIVAIYVGAVVAVSAFFYPIWAAIPIDPFFRQLHFWLPSWG
ncbi:dolichyl-phosphate-mannose--protein mannosyltransferase [Agromyces sp. MMS24-JH15]|uniref:dolichyl-phosphate-mannose--protein mannosyltransferase n=1 Tax=Agromyces sp. MMS24-JH15 TaxID=3243765 RepID=UPI003747B6BA